MKPEMFVLTKAVGINIAVSVLPLTTGGRAEQPSRKLNIGVT